VDLMEMKWWILIGLLATALVGGIAYLLVPVKSETVEQNVIVREEQVNDIVPDSKIVKTLITSEFKFEGENMKAEIIISNIRIHMPRIIFTDENGKNISRIEKFPFYIHFGVGERNTGGYSINILKHEKNIEEKIIYIDAFLKEPGMGEFVTTAFSYPSAALKVIDDLDSGEWTVIVNISRKDGDGYKLTEKIMVE
jgi:hypothetical protein